MARSILGYGASEHRPDEQKTVNTLNVKAYHFVGADQFRSLQLDWSNWLSLAKS